MYRNAFNLRKFYSNDIIIINNKLDENIRSFSDLFKNVSCYNNSGNFFELGAIRCALGHIEDKYDRIIILHNSFTLIKHLPNEVFTEDVVSFWSFPAINYSPLMPWLISKS